MFCNKYFADMENPIRDFTHRKIRSILANLCDCRVLGTLMIRNDALAGRLSALENVAIWLALKALRRDTNLTLRFY